MPRHNEIEGIEHEEMHGNSIIASKGSNHIDGKPVLIGNYVLMQDDDSYQFRTKCLIEEYKSH